MSVLVPFTEARKRFSELLARVASRHEHIVITRNGEPQAVIMSPDDYESMLETLEVLHDRETLDALAESERDVKAERLVSLDEVRRRFNSP